MVRLKRPLVFLDLEATGLDVSQDRIIEVALLRFEPPELRPEAGAYFGTLVNPGLPIPESVVRLTGIRDEDVCLAPFFHEIADEVALRVADADLAGYNAAAFDIPLLQSEFRRLGQELPGPADRLVLDPLEIWRRMEPRTLENAYRHFVGRDLRRPHRAHQDARATVEVFAAQVARYGLSGDLEGVLRQIRAPFLDSRRRFRKMGDDVVLCFGKYRGYTLREVMASDPEYLDWMLEHMDVEACRIIREHLEAGQGSE